MTANHSAVTSCCVVAFGGICPVCVRCMQERSATEHFWRCGPSEGNRTPRRMQRTCTIYAVGLLGVGWGKIGSASGRAFTPVDGARTRSHVVCDGCGADAGPVHGWDGGDRGSSCQLDLTRIC